MPFSTEGRFAQHVLFVFQRILGLFVMEQVRGGNVNRIDRVHQFAERVIYLFNSFVFLLQPLCSLGIDVVYPLQLDGAYRGRLLGEPARNASRPHNTYLYLVVLFLSQHGGRDAFGTRQIDHFAILLQVVEVSHPVPKPTVKDVDVVFLDVVYLLPRSSFL